ncbi:hypothetical protein SISSUDRAFT_1054222 [Sistotremastrum suecicum HHB10207 ss-3]|uniref:SGNH hydrolase n=1 Tax=Sistotremastrum suecicum HHB10207 ss-3 TaxID=1314776 RepID=A0A165YNN5_9AGAM|nr:hypothetical protein SISSUDRAFT_1054222 [Sistotremastrum suecicum HHB10207 ss-3]
MAIRLPKPHVIFAILLSAILLLVIHFSYREDFEEVWSSLPAKGRQYLGLGSDSGSNEKNLGDAVFVPGEVKKPNNEISDLSPVKGGEAGGPELPAYCDYCGPGDLLCKRYGEANLARSRAYEGANARLRRVLRKARSGQPIKIGIIGGSVSMGHGVEYFQNWHKFYHDWWKETFPNTEITLVNGAVPASESDYFETCYLEHIDPDVDIVVVEMAINDRRFEWLAEAYEYLIRELLVLPNKPAIINLQVMALVFPQITMGGDLELAVAMYYDTPVVNVRNLLLPHILRSNSGAMDDYWFSRLPNGSVDLRHMSAAGHKIMADLIISMSERVYCEERRKIWMESKGISDPFGTGYVPPEDGTLPGNEVLEEIPRLTLFSKYDHDTVVPPTHPTCLSLKSAKHPLVPLQADGWEHWIYKNNAEKPYLRATKPGSRISFSVKVGVIGRVRLTYLRSFSFGLGSVWCWIDEDHAGGRRLDGWWNVEHMNTGANSVVAKDVPAGDHTLRCELLKETLDPNGGTEFRIIAVDAI